MVRTRLSTISCFSVALGLCVSSAATAADKPIRKLTLDESAPVVQLFDGIDDGQLQVRISPKSAQDSTVSIKNLTDAPLTIALPKAAVGVHILPQFQQQGAGFLNPNGNTFGGGQQNQGQNPFGQSQSVGGTFQPMGNQSQGFPNQGNGNGNANNPFQGGNFFSIPPEKTVQLKLKTVCLNYGWPDPLPGMKYELRSVDSVISNPTLQKLLEIDSPRVDDRAKQAAAWHLANGLNWNQLATVPPLGANSVLGGTMFPAATLKAAQSLVSDAEEAAKNAEQEQTPPKAAPTARLTSASGK